ncbi:MAG: M28 family metallopeptidase [Cytophagaceae bacterium]
MKIILKLLLLTIPFTAHCQDMNRVRGYIDTLSSPGFHGRGPEFGGERKAAEYIKTKFQSFGLQPLDTSWFQTFRFNINTFPGKLSLKINGKKLSPGKDYIVNCISGGGKGKLKVLYIDSTYIWNVNKRNSFMAMPLKKIAVFYNEKDYSKLAQDNKDVFDKMHEAACVIELQNNKLTACHSQNVYSNPYFDVLASSVPKDLKTVSFRLDQQFVKGYTSQNVIGYIEGKTKPDSVVVITAHYDHLGRMGKDTYFPGANDNASGVSMLFELARHYVSNPPPNTMVFIAFGGEEAGLVGSKYYTQHPLFSLKRIKLLINLDLLGTGDEGMMVVNGTLHDREFKLLDSLNNSYGLLPAIKKRGPAANSDHYWFSEKGVPAFFFYTMGGIKAYHDIFDRPETLPLTKFAEVHKLITLLVNSL